jgi:hypothetical protein
MLHFLGPWQSFTVGSYRECGRDFVDVVLTPIYDLDSNLGNSRIRRTTQSWALAHGESIRRITGPHPTWVLIALVINLDDEVNDTDYLNLLFYEDYDYSGTWPQWLDSRLTPGRWLDYPALLCIAQAFDVAVLVVSVADGELMSTIWAILIERVNVWSCRVARPLGVHWPQSRRRKGLRLPELVV